jgi:creatinine amidohydrolase
MVNARRSANSGEARRQFAKRTMALPATPLLQDMSRVQARALATSGMLVLPLGATEQHGPHLPTGTDTLHVDYVARAASALVAGRIPIAVAPTLPFGSSHHHLLFGGTISFDTELYYRVLIDLGASIAKSGFKRLFILNGHGGNHEVAQLAARDLALSFPMSVAAGSWWAIAYDELSASGATTHGSLPGHAGSFETSLVMALAEPMLQRPIPRRRLAAFNTAAFKAPYRVELPGAWQKIDGYSDSPNEGTVEAGRQYLMVAVEAVSRAFLDFFMATHGRPVRHKPIKPVSREPV